MEEFREIPSFPDYEISNFGRVRTKSRNVRYVHAITNEEHFRITQSRFLKVYLNNRTDRHFVQLYRDKKSFNRTIHRLVAETFIDNPCNLESVNHIDGNRHNNCVSNLEWCTNEYNHYHATVNGLKAKGENIGTSKLNDRSVKAIKYLLNKGLTHYIIAEAFDVSRSTVTQIKLGMIWKHV